MSGTPRTDALQQDWHSWGTQKMMQDIWEHAQRKNKERP